MFSNLLNYDSLGKAHRGLNLAIIHNEITHKVAGPHSILPPLVLRVKNTGLGKLSLPTLGYSTRKMNLLKRNYCDEPIENIKEGIESTSRGREYLYTFSSKKTYRDKPKPNCLLTLSYNQSFNTITIVWRTTELAARWGADLMLVGEIIDSLELKEEPTIYLVLKHSYQELMVLPGIAELMGWTYDLGLSDKDFRRVFNRSLGNFYPPGLDENNLYEKWNPIKLVQKNLILHRKGEL